MSNVLLSAGLVGIGLWVGSPARVLAQDGAVDVTSAALFPASRTRFPDPRTMLTGGPESWSTRHPGVPPTLSLIVPGTGQLAMARRRGWAYLAGEVVGWVLYVNQRRSGAGFRDRYRDLAWEAARVAEGPRVDGDFEYYERMTQWRSSGGFDRNPGTPGVQPETDPSTFNGAIWDRARALFGVSGNGANPSDPSYRAALDYYADRAYDESFLWDWTGQGELRERYAAFIEESDDRFRNATVILGALMANHLVSAVDALITTRGISVELAPEATRRDSWELRMRWEWRP